MSSSSLDYAALSKTLNSMHHLRIDPGHLTLHLNPSVPLSDSISEGVQKALLDGAVVVAVKQLSFRSGDPTNRIAFRIARELKVWAMLHHPHILSLIGFHLDLARHNAWIISPYLANGNVTNFLKVELLGQTARLKLISQLLQAAQGIMYLHENDPPIIHGGIKASNVLVNDAGQAVITDFALATIVMDPGLHSGMTTSVTTHGSYRFLAPELIQGEPASLESDIWSFGCLMIEIACDRTPFQDISSEARVILKVIQGFMPDNVSTLEMPMDLKGLLMGCWEKEPKQRPSIERCCSALELAISDLAYDVELPEGDHWVRFDGDSLSGLGSQGSSPPPSPTRPFNVSPENELPGQLAIDDKYDAIRGRYADLMFGQWVRPNGRIVEVAVKYMRQIVVGTGRDSQVQTAEQVWTSFLIFFG
ncbi:Receptor-interacting serine/threonine-protein kinase 2 [Tulasnella sp. 417]|nr:Receptor-interacting serine/threonine-protein kinase 2 [Tulasnella sp. 417]